MKMMQHVYILDGGYSPYKKKGEKNFTLAIIPCAREATVIFFDDNYVAYVKGHIEYKYFNAMDLKMIKRTDIYESKEEIDKIVKKEMKKYLSYKDGSDYWKQFSKKFSSL